MTTLATDTRDASYAELREELNARQLQIYELLSDGLPRSNRQIAKELVLFPNQVTGRVMELREMGRVVPAGKTTDPDTGRTVQMWTIAPSLF